jgi:hypothetical protein
MLSPEKIAAIQHCYDIAGDWPDGAWWAFCEENGVDVDDLMAYEDERKSKEGKHGKNVETAGA